MKTKTFAALATMTVLLGGAKANAAITYEFAVTGGASNVTGLALDDLSSGSSTVGGVTLTASANQGVLNYTTSPNFGINSDGSDESDGFDNEQGAESMTFSFSVAGTLDSMDFDRVTEADGDSFSLIFSGGPTFNYSNVDLDGSDFTLINQAFSQDQDITLLWTGGGGFGLEAITITAVPEPHEYALVAGLGLLGFAVFRHRRRRAIA